MNTTDIPSLVERAARLAVEAHHGQVRKTDGSPYIVHPFMCALMLHAHDFGGEVIAAALVHDVLEDTPVPECELRESLGTAVADLVRAVSEDKSLSWEERKRAYADRIAASSVNVRAVSIADKIHNLESMLKAYAAQGEALWEHFSRGKNEQLWFARTMLASYQAGWEHPLIERYAALVSEFESLA